MLPLIQAATPNSIAPAATIVLMEAQADSGAAGKSKHFFRRHAATHLNTHSH